MRPFPIAIAITLSLGAAASLARPAVDASAPIKAAVAASTRTPANTARDIYRHPAETLAFFGVKPNQTIVEFSPSGGWYTEILAPLVRDKGVYYGLQSPGRGFDGLKAKFAAAPALYGKAKLVEWPAQASQIRPGSVDTLLTFRNVHNLIMQNKAADSFALFYTLVKPGGTLGIEEHRLPESRDATLEKTSGYLKVSTVRKLAEAAGFEYVGASEVNANPKDTADYPKGVWTLPPTFTLGDTDKARYAAIGESDRMTLRFRKPGK